MDIKGIRRNLGVFFIDLSMFDEEVSCIIEPLKESITDEERNRSIVRTFEVL